MRDQILERAIEAANGPAALARELGITSQAISQWGRCPIDRARQISEITKIPLHELRPDVWEPPVQAAE